jgi:DNA polymerase-3 subunit epsilon
MLQSDLPASGRPDAAPLPLHNDTDTPDFVVVDVETSCSRVSSICQIGIVGFRNGGVTFEYETLLDPLDEFHVFNTHIHGITPEHVAGQPCFGDVHAIIDGHLTGRTTVAHSHFDKGALAAACRVHDRTPIETTWLDSVRVAKRAWPHLASHRLNVLSQYLGIAHRHHDALSDARAAGLVIVRAIEHTGMTLADWLAPSIRRKVGPPPKPASEGPLQGQRVAILGEPRNGRLAQKIASLGGRIVSAVGSTTTILAITEEEPFDRSITCHADYRRARELQRSGSAIRILAQSDLIGSKAAVVAEP